ncbi:small integral membrane protein 19 isoform X1 [Ciconia boyciana]|uniref:small integral membrane protein 19 isoform X1 n=1 Tax=Ciconia boyciana TaxID=52775 RepID=UPI003B9F069E
MAAAAGGAGGGGSAALGDSGAIDYSVHEAWNEATNVYLLVVLASLALLVYARRNKRRIMRIFTLPPAAETPPEPNFYDSMKKIRLRQQLEMYSIGTKKDVLPTEECLLAFVVGVCSTAHNSWISLCLANQISFEVNVVVSLWLVYCGGDE